MQAWQIDTCTHVVKYTFVGSPTISDFGFSLPATAGRSITVSGCSSTISNSGGNGNECIANGGPYVAWTADGSMVKIDDAQCGSSFYVKATLTSLVVNGGDATLGMKGSTSCWTCQAVPYAFAAVTSCSTTSPSRSPSPSPPASATPSHSPSAPPASVSPSPSAPPASATPSPSAPPASVSPSRSATPAHSPSAPPASVSPSPSAPPASSTPSPSSPSASSSPSPSASASPSPSPSPAKPEDGAGAGAIAGGVVGGLAGVGAVGALIAGAGYLVHRMMNKPHTPEALSSALDAAGDNSGGVNALFVDAQAMQPNPIFDMNV